MSAAEKLAPSEKKPKSGTRSVFDVAASLEQIAKLERENERLRAENAALLADDHVTKTEQFRRELAHLREKNRKHWTIADHLIDALSGGDTRSPLDVVSEVAKTSRAIAWLASEGQLNDGGDSDVKQLRWIGFRWSSLLADLTDILASDEGSVAK